MTVNHLMQVRFLPGQQGVPNLKCWVIETYYQMSPSKLELGVLSNGCLADCKSVVFRHWGFESLHSHKQGNNPRVDKRLSGLKRIKVIRWVRDALDYYYGTEESK